MARKLKRMIPKSSQLSHDETTHAIAVDTETFLKSGGTVQYIPNGVSGYVRKPVKRIKLFDRPA